MRLEDGLDTLSRIELTNAEQALTNLLGMMGIIAQIYHLRSLHSEIKPTVHTLECHHRLANLFGCGTAYLRQGHSSNSILYIHRHGDAQTYLGDIA